MRNGGEKHAVRKEEKKEKDSQAQKEKEAEKRQA